MDVAALLATIHGRVPGVRVETAPSVDIHTTIMVPRDELVVVARELRDHPDLRFELLADVIAVDFWPREPRFELLYILVSIAHRSRVRVKVQVSGGDAHIATVSGIWPGANWLEREVWDLFGIVFDAHPDPRRLLMPEDWEGYPLRKDYPVQIKMPARTAEPLQVTLEQFRANVEKDRMSRRS